MLYLTSMLYLGFNTHCNEVSWFQRFPSLQCFISLQCLPPVSRFPSLRRRGHIECDHVLLKSVSLNFTSIFYLTPMLYLGFNAFLHVNALAHCNAWLQSHDSFHCAAEVTSCVTVFFFNLSPSMSLQYFISLQCFTMVSPLSFTSMLDLTAMLNFSFALSFTSTPRSHRVWPCFFWSVSLNLTPMLYLPSMI